jgi:hypothetical protein
MFQRERVYDLRIGDYSNGNGLRITAGIPDENGFIDVGLQLTFDISKMADNKKTKCNSASIEIYNLSRSQAALLEGEYLECTLMIGYEEQGPRVVVTGNVTDVSTRKSGDDRVTQIRMGEGYTDLNHKKLKQMVSPGKTVQDVIDEIVKQMPGVSRGSVLGTNLNNPIVHGWRLTGTPREMLKKVCDAYDLEYSVSGGVLNVTDVNGLVSKDVDTAPVVSPTTGLIDEPFYTSEDGRKHPKDKRRRRGVQCVCLLNTELIPGRIVKLEDTVINGFYRINATRFNGDFRGNPWYAEVLCSEIAAEELA